MGKYASTDPNHVFPNRFIPPAAALKAHERREIDANGCWLSTFAVNRTNGYATVGWRDEGTGYATTAHRAAWVHRNGQIPDGMVVDHTCHNRRCVNPSHLRLLSRGENARRQVAGDFPLGQCRYGHPLSESRKRLKGVSAGLTYCGACQKERNDILTATRAALYSLELAYGLGGHEGKRNYPHKMRVRQARVDAARDARLEALGLVAARESARDE
jgi:hypothetical protein